MSSPHWPSQLICSCFYELNSCGIDHPQTIKLHKSLIGPVTWLQALQLWLRAKVSYVTENNSQTRQRSVENKPIHNVSASQLKTTAMREADHLKPLQTETPKVIANHRHAFSWFFSGDQTKCNRDLFPPPNSHAEAIKDPGEDLALARWPMASRN